MIEREVVDEASGGADVTGQPDPTNALLTPEFEPETKHIEPPEANAAQISDLGTPVPGQSSGVEPVPAAAKDYDPRNVARQIIKDRIGSVKTPTHKGSLFARDRDGKPVINGIDSPELARTRQENSDRVKEILKNIK